MGDIIVTLQDDNEEDVQTMTTVLGCHTITIHEESVSPTIVSPRSYLARE